jgi:hypothetical protein
VAVEYWAKVPAAINSNFMEVIAEVSDHKPDTRY